MTALRCHPTFVFPEPIARWLRSDTPPARPMMPLHDSEIDQLERMVARERKRAVLSHDSERLVAAVEHALKALKTQRDAEVTARWILTLMWQSRQWQHGDFWRVINREKDAMACEMLQKYFGGPHTESEDSTH